MTTSRDLKVYNRFGELVLHLRFVLGDPIPLRIEDGTQELREAVRSLFGHDFDETVVVEKQRRRFQALWGSPKYLDALAGYWSSNFGWRTRLVEVTPNWGAVEAEHVSDFTIFNVGEAAAFASYAQVQAKHPDRYEHLQLWSSDARSSEAVPVSRWPGGSENEIGTKLQTASLFDLRSTGQSIFRFQPTLDSVNRSSHLSVACAVSQATAMVRLKDNNPKIPPRFAVSNPETWAA